MKIRDIYKKAVVSALCLVLVVTGCHIGAAAESEEVSELRSAIAEKRDNIESAQDGIAQMERNEEAIKNFVEQLDKEIAQCRSDIEMCNKAIDLRVEQIAKLEKRLAEIEQEITLLNGEIVIYNVRLDGLKDEVDNEYQALESLLRTQYLTGERSTLGVLLTADDFADFLAGQQMLASFADEKDRIVKAVEAAVAQTEAMIEVVEAKKDDLEKNKRELSDTISARNNANAAIESAKATIEARKATMEDKQDKSNGLALLFGQQKEGYEAAIKQYEADIQALGAQISNMLGSLSSGDGTIVSGLICPLDMEGRYISSGYSGRISPITGESEIHGGIDICAPGCDGAPILAAADGIVVTAEYHYSWGNYIVIDHGNGLATLYAHCSDFIAAVGDVVQQGDEIAHVGSTGYATGPHLHLEVWVNGQRVDPTGSVPV